MRELPVHLVTHPPHWPVYHPTALTNLTTACATPPPPRANPMVTVAAADVALGKPTDWASYGWDNEYGSRTLHVREFQASRCLVSNGEFYAFVKSGGYVGGSCSSPGPLLGTRRHPSAVPLLSEVVMPCGALAVVAKLGLGLGLGLSARLRFK